MLERVVASHREFRVFSFVLFFSIIPPVVSVEGGKALGLDTIYYNYLLSIVEYEHERVVG